MQTMLRRVTVITVAAVTLMASLHTDHVKLSSGNKIVLFQFFISTGSFRNPSIIETV